MKTFDAIVIGGGHNGLVTAGLLARAGLRVVVLERRDIVGGACVTEEIAPGFRASTGAYIASMMRPEVIRSLGLQHHGLRMTPCDPILFVPSRTGKPLFLWQDPRRTAAGIETISRRDAAAFLAFDEEIKGLARWLEPFFMEATPPLDEGARALPSLWRLGKRFRKIGEAEAGRLARFLTASVFDLVDARFESPEVKNLIGCSNVLGAHGGPMTPCSASGLLFHSLSGGDELAQGFMGHVEGGMGAITRALASAARSFGAEVRTGAPVARVLVKHGRAEGVALASGEEVRARVVVSNADPKRTFLGLVDQRECDAEFLREVAAIKMAGPCAKINYALSEAPVLPQMPAGGSPAAQSDFTICPDMQAHERAWDDAKHGRASREPYVDCVVPTHLDPGLAPAGKHVLTAFVQYAPYRLADGDWRTERERLADRVADAIGEFAPNFKRSIVARDILSPVDLEERFGLTEGNIFHGDLNLGQLFLGRPLPGWSRYRTPVRGLYLCGAGTHPGGGVTGAPGWNAARQILADWRKKILR
ncbi:MAG TPA: NAD(P)/FAD-dependent oxidoreductase [Candidatus Polarisedimenticolia bacterium]|nr:NAD(P)/FAD-dependent oxidoreductase [Candidatus Polarisedimenticolia bacterium]